MTKDTSPSAIPSKDSHPVTCDTCAYAEGIIKRLEDKNAKPLADWRRMKEALNQIAEADIYKVSDVDMIHFAETVLSSLSYQDSPTAHD